MKQVQIYRKIWFNAMNKVSVTVYESEDDFRWHSIFNQERDWEESAVIENFKMATTFVRAEKKITDLSIQSRERVYRRTIKMSLLPKTPEAYVSVTCSTPKSSTPNCAICLDPISTKKKCFAYICLHEFCYDCLTKWLERKNECPLCKRPLVNIIYDVQSPGTYKLKHLDHAGGNNSESDDDLLSTLLPSPINITPSLLSLFGYRSASIGPFVTHYGLYEHQIPDRTTVLQWRRFCYEYNLFAVSFEPPVAHRSRDFYRQNANHLNVLKRWLVREMYALSNVVDAVITPQQIEMVLSGVELSDIDSDGFLFFVPPLEPKTDHFLHELKSFVNSVHNHSLNVYDANVKYDFHNRDNGDAYPRTNAQDVRPNDATSDLNSDGSDDDMPNYGRVGEDVAAPSRTSISETNDNQMDSDSDELDVDMSSSESSDSSQSDIRMNLSFFDSNDDMSDIELDEVEDQTNGSISIIITNDSDISTDSSDSDNDEDSTSTDSDQNDSITIDSDSDFDSNSEDWNYGFGGAKTRPTRSISQFITPNRGPQIPL